MLESGPSKNMTSVLVMPHPFRLLIWIKTSLYDHLHTYSHSSCFHLSEIKDLSTLATRHCDSRPNTPQKLIIASLCEALYCVAALSCWNEPLLELLRSLSKKIPSRVCRNKLMWQHPNHCIHMLIDTQVTWTVISPQGLSPSKLVARPLFLCL